MNTQTSNGRSRAWRSRWAAVGAAVAVTVGASGLFVANAASSEPSSFVAITPTRILDSRTDVGLNGPFPTGFSQKLQVTGTVATQPPGGVTAVPELVVPDNATAVMFNVTAVRPGSQGFVSIRPGDATGIPATSNINFGSNSPNTANSVTVALPLSSSQNAGQIDIYVQGAVGEVLMDVAGYFVPAVGKSIVAESAKTDDVEANGADFDGQFGVALSVTVEATGVGIIQIVGGTQLLTVGTEDDFNCRLTRGSGNTANSSDDDLADSDRGEYLPSNRVGGCTTNGTVAVGEGTHIINLVVRKGESSSLIDDATLQALFIEGGFLDNTN